MLIGEDVAGLGQSRTPAGGQEPVGTGRALAVDLKGIIVIGPAIVGA
jgi:hypothetical protein